MAQNFDWTISRKIQYNNSKTLNTILQGLNDMLSISAEHFINGVLNIDTAQGAQLDIIGRLVGANRIVYFPLMQGGQDFGFNDSSWYGFNEFGGTFNVKSTGTTVTLNDDAFKTYIKFKAYSNISNCSLGSINYMLQQLFGNRGISYATQTGLTEITLTFNFNLYSFERNLILNRYIPIPAGYSLVLVQN